MKKLGQFTIFDFSKFSDGKLFQVTGVKPWTDGQNRELVLGTSVEVAITKDETEYVCKPGETVTNLFEKFSIKTPQTAVAVQVGDLVEPVNPVATVYGDYRDKLSVKAEGIQILEVEQ